MALVSKNFKKGVGAGGEITATINADQRNFQEDKKIYKLLRLFVNYFDNSFSDTFSFRNGSLKIHILNWPFHS